MLPATEGSESGAGGPSGAKVGSGRAVHESTQNTQYDRIGTRYLEIKTLPAVEPEVLSILDALGDGVRRRKCLGKLHLLLFHRGK
jgi:hypothetical protein